MMIQAYVYEQSTGNHNLQEFWEFMIVESRDLLKLSIAAKDGKIVLAKFNF
jgi:hypothetical protein